MKAINIISFNVPFPANYGGVIDVFYKIYWLHKAGIKIHLHCFNYGRAPSPVLENLCEKVYYYKRKTGIFSNFSLLPYTVKSRQSVELEENLLTNDFPILFEVLHTCYLLNDKRFKHRKKIYRHCNIEHDYYLELSKSERNFLKKLYLKVEAWKLKRFESIVNSADLILAVNQLDTKYLKLNYPHVKSVYLPCFHANEKVTIDLLGGNYILFHGNLSVPENYEAVFWLLEYVFIRTNLPVVIAGLNPPPFLRERIGLNPGVKLIDSPDDLQMDNLIKNAQIHILYTPQSTGLKLKLLNVLFKGKFVICNPKMVAGTGLSDNNTLYLADTADKFIAYINKCSKMEFSVTDIKEREMLIAGFDNALLTQNLLQEIYND